MVYCEHEPDHSWKCSLGKYDGPVREKKFAYVELKNVDEIEFEPFEEEATFETGDTYCSMLKIAGGLHLLCDGDGGELEKEIILKGYEQLDEWGHADEGEWA